MGRIAALLLVLAVASCGSGSSTLPVGPQDCSGLSFKPCGGDLVGTWTSSIACNKTAFCSDTITLGDGVKTMTFNADGSYVINDTTTSVTDRNNESCAANTCPSAPCSACSIPTLRECTSDAAHNCSCKQASTPGGMSAGTYTLNNEIVVFSDHTVDYFCVSGQSLLLGETIDGPDRRGDCVDEVIRDRT